MGVEFRALWGKLRSVRGDVGHGGGGKWGRGGGKWGLEVGVDSGL